MGGSAQGVIVIGLLLAIVAACPAGVDARACAAQEACVGRAYRAREASDGVSPREAALVSRLEAEHVCALSGWSLAEARAEVVRVTTATAAVCPPCPAIVGGPVCEPGPTVVNVLALVGACAVCGGGVAFGAWAQSRGDP